MVPDAAPSTRQTPTVDGVQLPNVTTPGLSSAWQLDFSGRVARVPR
jgi:hypothetical protein